jgi:hydroxymethylpyrimidine pyrophosphatase-like HAD family hydrolase
MLEVAGMSVAMGNAMDAARKAAKWETLTNDEGGVGRFLERVFFAE